MAGHGRVVLLAGEPGIGKTRLAEEAVLRADRGGVEVAWGRCSEEGAPSFWPWVQVLRGLLAGVSAERLLAVLGPDAPELAQLLPELTELVGAPPAVLDVEVVRFRLCHAVSGLLHRLAVGRPLLLVLDDLHWADAASLRLLSILGGTVRGARLLVVGTYREPDAQGDGRLARTFAALAREAPVDRMVLGGLSAAEVTRMMAVELGAEPDEELVRLVHRRTDGNPFFRIGAPRRTRPAGWPPSRATPSRWSRRGRTARTRSSVRRLARCAPPGRAWPAATGPAPARRRRTAGGTRRRPGVAGTLRVVDELVATAAHVTEQYGNNRIEADHGRLKARLRPMRGLKQVGSTARLAAMRLCRIFAAATTSSPPTSHRRSV